MSRASSSTAPSNEITPDGLGAAERPDPRVHAESSIRPRPACSALAAVGGSSPAPPRLIVLRHRPPQAPPTPRLALIGKGVTFDTGGYFLKPQPEIVKSEGRHGRAGRRCSPRSGRSPSWSFRWR